MLKLIGFTTLLSLTVCFLMLSTSELNARSFRRGVTRPYSTTNRGTAQAGMGYRTAEKPQIPDLATEIQAPSQQESKSPSPAKTEPKVQVKRHTALTEPITMRGFSSYELLGLNFQETIQELPALEQEILEQMLQETSIDYAAIIAEKYPEVRPEVAETLAQIAQGVHQRKTRGELGKIVHEMPLKTYQLSSKEVLAINQELAPTVDEEEYRAINGLNQFRMRCGLLPCVIDLLLVVVSRGHSNDMMRFGFFSHYSPVSGKGTFTSRAGQYGASASAENIYKGSYSGNAANSAWINSSGHRANMLGGYSRVGVGRIGGIFTQMFGR